MLYWVIQITVISIILIFLVHHLINFFKATLTVPKIKDLVNTPAQKYENIYNILQKKSKTSVNPDSDYSENQDYTLIDLLPKKEIPTMKNELKNFLKKQLQHSSDNGTSITSLDSSTTFSPF
jgi:uncharacterized membrane-anchored protein YitT (DUF2179 family)